MTTLVFKVKGSQPEPYTVTFTRSGSNITATCTCRAGVMKSHCKHRVNLLLGDITGITDGHDQLPDLMGLIQGSDVEAALNHLMEAEKQLQTAKTNRSKAAKTLSDRMND